MPYNPEQHHRRSIRLKGFDYSQSAIYFITICIQDRKCLLGSIEDNRMLLSDPGNLVSEQWLELPIRFPSIVIDEFVVMPNHFHGIIYTTDSTLSKPSLSEIVGSFKSIVTHKYIDGVNNKNWVPFDRRLWQRNYYERIVRNDLELQNIQQYIQLAQQDSPSIAVLRLGVGGMRVSDRRAKPHQRRMHPHTRRKGIASGRWAGV